MVRIAKIAVAAAMGLVMLVVALGNVLDYGTNFDVVQHILSMDEVPVTPFKWRAITSPALHHVFYLLIIAVEFASAALSLYGAWILWGARTRSAGAFNAAKSLAIAGLALGFLLYSFGFMGVGGEWFQMWRAGVYNLQEPAFRFIGMLGLSLIFVSLVDIDLI
jgi:predicted small integral membrane protein